MKTPKASGALSIVTPLHRFQSYHACSFTLPGCTAAMCTTVTTNHKLKLLLLTDSKAESDCYYMTYNTVL